MTTPSNRSRGSKLERERLTTRSTNAKSKTNRKVGSPKPGDNLKGDMTLASNRRLNQNNIINKTSAVEVVVVVIMAVVVVVIMAAVVVEVGVEVVVEEVVVVIMVVLVVIMVVVETIMAVVVGVEVGVVAVVVAEVVAVEVGVAVEVAVVTLGTRRAVGVTVIDHLLE